MRLLKSGSSSVRRTCRNSSGRISDRLQHRGVVSISAVVVNAGFRRSIARRARGLSVTCRTGGSSINPARSSRSISPRHTIERSAPLGCTQFQASHSFVERARRLAPGLAAISSRMKITSASVTARPRYFNITSTRRSVAGWIPERKSYLSIFLF